MTPAAEAAIVCGGKQQSRVELEAAAIIRRSSSGGIITIVYHGSYVLRFQVELVKYFTLPFFWPTGGTPTFYMCSVGACYNGTGFQCGAFP